MKHQVAADITYLDGPLTGMMIPGGFRVTTSPDEARRVVAWLLGVERTHDFVRAVGTGHRYTVERVTDTELSSPVYV